MRQFLLAVMLIAIPATAFAIFQIFLATAPASVPAASLGDLSNLKTIVADVQKIAETGDLAAAKERIADFETAWDDAEATMRPLNEAGWGHVDDAADAALHTLRAQSSDSGKIMETLGGLMASLDNPSGGDVAEGGIKFVAGIAVSDASGHPLACEDMLKELRGAIDGGKIEVANQTVAQDFLAKAVERCNADDDAHANEFSAQGLRLASHGQ